MINIISYCASLFTIGIPVLILCGAICRAMYKRYKNKELDFYDVCLVITTICFTIGTHLFLLMVLFSK